MGFHGKVIFITGTSAGIGAALAREFHRRGGTVVLTARRRDRLEQLQAELGERTLVVPIDVTDTASVDAAIAQAITELGKIDVLVCNAGFGVNGAFTNLTLEDFQRQFDTNVWGMLRSIYAALPELTRQKGQVVLMGSVAGYLSTPGSTPYAMSKFAVRCLAEGIRPELKQMGIALTLISPGFVDSEIRQVNNLNKPKGGDGKDPLPSWIRQNTAQAARQIVDATELRRPEAILSYHGKILVWITRFFPGLLRWFLSKVRRDANKKLRFDFRS